jgi:hypothetical protein
MSTCLGASLATRMLHVPAERGGGRPDLCLSNKHFYETIDSLFDTQAISDRQPLPSRRIPGLIHLIVANQVFAAAAVNVHTATKG